MNVNDAAIKAKIRIYREQKVLKSKALRQLIREFGVSEKVVDELWLEVKQEKKITNSTAKKENEIKDKKEKLIASEEITVGKIKQSLEEAKVQAEDKYINKDLKVLKKVATVQGKYDTYQKEGSKVKSSKLEFNNSSDIEEYEKKLIAEEEEIFLKKKAEIRLRLNEVLDVMLMEV
ncbi:MAG: hypothetical protein E7E70_23180 [Escherichia coli]|nr:hypothetical protein [Escherichia coli]